MVQRKGVQLAAGLAVGAAAATAQAQVTLTPVDAEAVTPPVNLESIGVRMSEIIGNGWVISLTFGMGIMIMFMVKRWVLGR